MKYFLWKVCKTDYKTLWVIPNISGYHQFLGAQMKILYFFPIFMCICSEGEILHLVSGRPCIQYPATPTHTHATPQAGFLTLRSFCMESTWIWTHSLGPKTHNNQNLKNWRPGKDPRRSEPQKTQGGTRDHCVRGPTGTCLPALTLRGSTFSWFNTRLLTETHFEESSSRVHKCPKLLIVWANGNPKTWAGWLAQVTHPRSCGGTVTEQPVTRPRSPVPGEGFLCPSCLSQGGSTGWGLSI